MAYQIDFIDSIYIKDFYNDIIPQMSEYIHSHFHKELIFNFVDLNFISPNVVPNILNIADIYKKYFDKRKIVLKLSWNPELLAYLEKMNFFKFSKQFGLFEYNHDMIGGYDPYSTNENCNLIFSKVGSDVDDIWGKVKKLMLSMRKYEKIEKNVKDNEIMLSDIFYELIENANEYDHGNSNAYGLFQINSYKEDKNVAYISICDNGYGITKSINAKFSTGEGKPRLTEKRNSTFYYILEAIFWHRANPSRHEHGLYDVTKMVLEKGGKIAIHSQDTYAGFNRYFQDLFDLTAELTGNNQNMDNGTYSLLDEWERRNSKYVKYQGVHIDIELPLEHEK